MAIVELRRAALHRGDDRVSGFQLFEHGVFRASGGSRVAGSNSGAVCACSGPMVLRLACERRRSRHRERGGLGGGAGCRWRQPTG